MPAAPSPPAARTKADAPPARPRPAFDRDVAPVLARYCLACHEGDEAPGGVSLAGRPADPGLWARIADALRSGAMPPPGRPRPDAPELAALDAFLDRELARCGDGAEPARMARRLNRDEYNNTASALVGLDIRPADDFPADDVGYGFDTVGDVLAIPPILAEKYLAGSAAVVEAAARSPEAWRRLMDPLPADPGLALYRGEVRPVRSPPRKRVGVPDARPAEVDPALRELERAYAVLRSFADRASRRPATHDELTRLLGFVEAARRDGEGLEEGIKMAMRGALVSPHFLFRLEDAGGAAEDGAGGFPADFGLAARLSYFLWSGPPDDELTRLAAAGTLRQADRLEAEVRRLLRDPRSEALARRFFGQWLRVDGLAHVTPDPARFPDFDEPLRSAMAEETRLFVASILREDRSIFDLLDAEDTFVNERLARHYGLEGVRGDHFRRVSLAGTPRAGVLTHASVLTSTSNPTRTSPSRRGRWVLETLLASPQPPPPPGVEGLKVPGGGTPHGTLRQQLERHRDDPSCASCHRRMDPIGFALENFDAVGGWRAREGGAPIDASGTLPDGRTVRGPGGLRAAILARRDDFGRGLAENMLIYANGRGPRPGDRAAIDEIARETARGGSRVSALVLAIVRSRPFLGRPAGG